MCNDRTLREESRRRRESGLSRRQFDLLALGAAAVALLPARSQAAGVRESMVDVQTAAGVADCYFVHPTGGKHPGVLLWPDFVGRRPAYEQMAGRLAQSGYAVLVINPYYRGKRAPVVAAGASFEDEAVQKELGAQARRLSAAGVAQDAQACVAFLDRQSAVDARRKMAVMGYCMGGGFAFHSAAAVPERIAALATFHAGGLVSDRPGSPHLLIPRLRAHALIAIAEDDDKDEPQTKHVLREAFAGAKLPAEIEVYAGTQHGWCTPDMTAYYNEAQARRAWARMLDLYDAALV